MCSFLRHLASWGFIVVAPRDTNTGSGESVLAALETLKSREGSLPFAGQVDTSVVGALGHSQVLTRFTGGDSFAAAYICTLMSRRP